MNTYTKAALKKFNATNLVKIATEEMGINASNLEGLTKAQLINVMLDPASAGLATQDENPAPETSTPSQEVKEEAKPTVGEVVDISETEVGDVIRYESSKKLYLVTSKTEKDGKVTRRLYSATQQFNSSKQNFNVVRVLKGSGELTEDTAAEFNQLVEAHFTSKKNANFETMIASAQADLEKLANKATPTKEEEQPATEETADLEAEAEA